MSAEVDTVVRCSSRVSALYHTLRSVEVQSNRGSIVLVTDQSTPDRALPWLDSLAERLGLVRVHSMGRTPAAVRNEGILAARSTYVMCVDAGDALDPHHHDRAVAALEASHQAALATSWMQVLGPGSVRTLVGPRRVDLPVLLSDTTAILDSAMFRRAVWESVGRFDEGLPALDGYDLWLRMLEAGYLCEVVAEPLLLRRLAENALYRQAWEATSHETAFARIVKKHHTLFAGVAADALCAREHRLTTLTREYHRLLERRDDTVRRLAESTARVEALRLAAPPDAAAVDLADLQRTSPISRNWGYERGGPVDRYYIERFLEERSSDIAGVVLEVQEPDYTTRFGGANVTQSDVLDLDESNPRATVVSDLRCPANIAADSYDCIVLTQTLHVVDDMAAVLCECARILRPGGVLLATLPCASRVCLEYGDEGDHWRVTEAGARSLFSAVFSPACLDVRAHGNVLANTAFLHGLGVNELTSEELDADDPYFPLLVTVRAQKDDAPLRHQGKRAAGVATVGEGAILLYHRVADVALDVHGLAIPTGEFRRQMTFLRDTCHLMPLDALVAGARAATLPPRAVAVTFDDGYLDNLTEASPVLLELGVPATFFLTTDRLDDPYVFWWHELERLLIGPDLPPPAGELEVEIPGSVRTFRTSTRDERLEAHRRIYEAIVRADAASRDAAIEQLRVWRRLPSSAAPEHRRMTAFELRTLAGRDGHSVGAHTVRHLMLPHQPLAVQQAEVHESREALHALLGRPVTLFAYPFGAVDEGSEEVVRGAGFDAAVSCEVGLVRTASNRFRLPRLEVTPTVSSDFSEWLTGWQNGRPPSRRAAWLAAGFSSASS